MVYFLLILLVSPFDTTAYAGGAAATSNSLSYQGRIVKNDGKPLEYSNVNFIFQITDPSGQCIIYQEHVTGINLSGTTGIFDVPIGLGNIAWPKTETSVTEIFNNSKTYQCASCSGYSCEATTDTYVPNAGDGRKMLSSFYDGEEWRKYPSGVSFHAVPFAGYAEAVQKIGDKIASDFVLRSEVNGGANCSGGKFLTWNTSSNTFGCDDDPRPQEGLTAITATSPLVINGDSGTPVVSLQIASSSQNGYISSADNYLMARYPYQSHRNF